MHKPYVPPRVKRAPACRSPPKTLTCHLPTTRLAYTSLDERLVNECVAECDQQAVLGALMAHVARTDQAEHKHLDKVRHSTRLLHKVVSSNNGPARRRAKVANSRPTEGVNVDGSGA